MVDAIAKHRATSIGAGVILHQLDAVGLVSACAFVVSPTPSDALAEELKAFARERLDRYKSPRDVVFVDVMPRTHLGKVDRGALAKSRRSL